MIAVYQQVKHMPFLTIADRVARELSGQRS
jgi:hypothetical protein